MDQLVLDQEICGLKRYVMYATMSAREAQETECITFNVMKL